MYCMNCGVKLGDGEEKCPLCGLRAYHPDIPREVGAPLYPKEWTAPKVEESGWRYLLTLSFVLAITACLLTDIFVAHAVTWSALVMASLAAGYVIFVLPLWFRRPNPMIFLPMDLAAAELLLLFINCFVGGHWFLSFAFPVTALYGGLLLGTVALVKYVRRGWFYLLGGVCIAWGCSTMLLEFFEHITFGTRMFLWSLYPTAVFSAIGLFWILAGIIRPLGNALRKRIFL